VFSTQLWNLLILSKFFNFFFFFVFSLSLLYFVCGFGLRCSRRSFVILSLMYIYIPALSIPPSKPTLFVPSTLEMKEKLHNWHSVAFIINFIFYPSSIFHSKPNVTRLNNFDVAVADGNRWRIVADDGNFCCSCPLGYKTRPESIPVQIKI
jgi:hypothetical protein